MPRGIAILYRKPAEAQWWNEFIDSVADQPEYAPLVASRASFEAAVDNAPGQGPLNMRRRYIDNPSGNNPNEKLVEWVLYDMPETVTTDEDAANFWRSKIRELNTHINDAPITETAEESFDGVARVHPRHLYMSWGRYFNQTHGYEVVSMRLVEINDFEI
jgi:hypothetical protein